MQYYGAIIQGKQSQELITRSGVTQAHSGGCIMGRVHIGKVVPEQYRYVGSAVCVNALCRQ